ncbi:MAG: hypothetical protein KDA68_01280 [Planctomycetaceae bacterium]|nr:hypothetical protein [Planctomycetaceae bacterium]
MNRVFVLFLIALLLIQQFPCDCQGEGMLRPCTGECAGHHEEAEHDTEGACPEEEHHEQSGPVDHRIENGDVVDADVPTHSHPKPLCRHLRAARSIDRVRVMNPEANLRLVGLTFPVDLPKISSEVPIATRGVASEVGEALRAEVRLSSLNRWLI